MSLYNFEQVIHMRRRIRHRLFGAIILTLIGVIILPMIFDHARSVPKNAVILQDIDSTQYLTRSSVVKGTIATQPTTSSLDMQWQPLTLDEDVVFNEPVAPMVNKRRERGFSGVREPMLVTSPTTVQAVKQEESLSAGSELCDNTPINSDDKITLITEEVDKKSVRADTEEIRSLHAFQKKGSFLLILDRYHTAAIHEESLENLRTNSYHIDWVQQQQYKNGTRLIVIVGPYTTKVHAESELVRLGRIGFEGRVFKK